MSITVLLGLQWGDEGKGKMIDILASTHKHVVRSHGGANAGHTLVIGGVEYKFHLVPSGVHHSHVRCYLGGGVVFDPELFLEELKQLVKGGIDYKERLFISLRAHVLLPYHKFLDKLQESARGQGLIGTTGKGIGPCYSDKVARMGITVGDFLDAALFKQKLIHRYSFLDPSIQSECPLEPLLEKASLWRHQLQGMFCDVEHHLATALKRGEDILIEGAHGSMLDISYGTYPYVTSSGCIASSVLAGCGLGPRHVNKVYGVVKTYTTRVGSGPMPTALSDEEQSFFMSHHQAREIGTTTGRLRRMGWLDLPLLRRSIELSSVSDIVLTKLDILDGLEKIKICTHYHYKSEVIDIFPMQTELLEQLEPQYLVLEGWKSDTSAIQEFNALPKAAQTYIQTIEKLLGVPVNTIFVGPDREQTIRC